MKAIRRTALGDPRQMLEIVDLPDIDEIPAGFVLLEMQYAPIHQHDLLAEAALHVSSSSPMAVGVEGLGRVIARGDGVDEAILDTWALAPVFSAWSERVLASADELIPLPDADPLQLSMLRINPSTAWLLLSEFVSLKPGDWIIQNAANSGVGRAVLAFAKDRGLRTLNLVRRPEVMEEIGELSNGAVLLDRDDALGRIGDMVGDAPIHLALDAVGGASSTRLGRALSPNGILVSYARLSGGNAPAGDRPALHGERRFARFCLGDPEHAPKLRAALIQAAALLRDGKLHAPVAAVYPVIDYARAVAHAVEGGKVVLDLRPGRWS